MSYIFAKSIINSPAGASVERFNDTGMQMKNLSMLCLDRGRLPFFDDELLVAWLEEINHQSGPRRLTAGQTWIETYLELQRAYATSHSESKL